MAAHFPNAILINTFYLSLSFTHFPTAILFALTDALDKAEYTQGCECWNARM